jgi:Zn-dependent protease
MSIVIHELAHAVVADALGDPTPRLQGRISLNPFNHLELIGSLIIPVISYLAGGFIFGWAKPVIINPYNFTRRKFDEVLVAIAGPISNFLIAGLFILAVKLGMTMSYFVGMVVTMNIVLGLFNLIPIPPLDGSKLLFAFLPDKYDHIRRGLEQFGFIALIFLISVISPIIGYITTMIVSSLL